MSETVEFTVHGPAKPGYNLIPGRSTKTGRHYARERNPEVKVWQALVAHEARLAMNGRELLDGPLVLALRFVRPRPKDHWNTKGELNAKGRRTPWPATIPDLSKLERPVEDALKEVVWHDDGQVCRKSTEKVFVAEYGEQARCEVAVEPAPFDRPAGALSGSPASGAGSDRTSLRPSTGLRFFEE